MSYQTDAILFYGFPLPPADFEKYEAHETPDIRIDLYGTDGDSTKFVAVKKAGHTVDIYDAALRLPAPLTIDPGWDATLRAFCERSGVPWPTDGAAWHLAASRF